MGSNGDAVPQWKRDLIQRRRLQTKALASSGASLELCSALVAGSDKPQLHAGEESPRGATVPAKRGPTRASSLPVTAEMRLEPDHEDHHRLLARPAFVEDCCSDGSSEELRYGPGIVNKLRSKYLNLTLRESTKCRPSVQGFRRALSLEDLLDCDERKTAATARKFVRKSASPAAKVTARHMSEPIKRARSVEKMYVYGGREAGTLAGRDLRRV